MITVNESLAEYLRVLKEYQRKNNFSVVLRKSVLEQELFALLIFQ